MTYDAVEVAKWILFEAKRQGIFMTHMKLQKLLYYAQAYIIGMTGKPLFENEIQAWKHGPVTPDVYHLYSKYGKSVIDNVEDVKIPDEYLPYIVMLIKEKGHYSASELREMTHQEDTWENAHSHFEGEVISHKAINDFFQPLFWTSDEEDEYQPSFEDVNEEKNFFHANITDEELDAIIKSR